MTHPYLLDDKLRGEWLSGLEELFLAPRRYVPGGWGLTDDSYLPMPARLVYYDEIQRDYDQDDAERIEYLKQITTERYNGTHRTVQQLRRERRAVEAARDNERFAVTRRVRWQRPTRA